MRVDQIQFTKESLVQSLSEIAQLGWIENRRGKNHGAFGNTIEDMLGIPENNLPIPNAAEWELKTARKGSTALVTLFHWEPSPRGMRLVPQMLLPLYGWRHARAGDRYPANERSFRQTLDAEARTSRGFGLVVNHETRRVEVSFDFSAIADGHSAWKKFVEDGVGGGELNPQPYWGFEDLKYKVGSKLTNSFFVEVATKKEGSVEYFRVEDVLMLSGLDFGAFLKGLQQGKIKVDFDARTGHNHGTKFRVQRAYLPELYRDKKVVVG